ncbi:MAG: polymer-forming cytoskeletal protein [Nitrospirota bacterium]|jgi:cytoskeletal protein CcmA (bactofilin family)
MFNKADKFQDVSRTPSRDDELREQFPRSQPHPARSFEQSHSPMRIGNTVIVKGELTAAEDMVIFGRVEGTITVNDHTVTIGKGATIEAEITAHSVVVEGQVTGNVEALEQLEISPDGVVIGNVKTPSLVIRDGATLKGSVDMDADRPRPAPKPKKQEEPPPAEEKSSPFKRERQEDEKVSTTG